jgi:Arc/MetJ-type ribon-helix-helix transcriptional regulator
MSSVEKVSIALSTELLALVKQAGEAGNYTSSSEVVREALREWKGRRGSHASAMDSVAVTPAPIEERSKGSDPASGAADRSALRPDFDFKSALKSLFSRSVDVVELSAQYLADDQYQSSIQSLC